jgi:glycosyltransferase involved in cell wall biosynthesis
MISVDLPKVGVIIPVYNGEKFIKEAINSVLNQTYKNLEIICVDDGSTDNTRALITENFASVLYLYQKNKGEAGARNLGLKSCTCEFIAFLDADDIWFPEKIERQLSIMRSDGKVGMVYTNGIYTDKNGIDGGILIPRTFKENNDPAELLMRNYIKSPSSVMVKRSVLEDVGFFDGNLTSGADHDLWLKIIEKFKIRFGDEPLFKYRVHENQLSNNVKMWLNGFIILENACKRYHYPLMARIKRRSVLYYRLGEYNWKHNERLSGIKYFVLAGLLDPFRSLKFASLETVKLLTKNK